MIKAEEALKEATINPNVIKCISGSRLYGTDIPTSDWDIRGVTIPPFEYLLGIKTVECQELPGEDHKVYTLKRFLQLVLKGDSQMLELLFTPKNKILEISKYGQQILDLRGDIISFNIYNRIMGYGYSEWRKAEGVKMVIEGRKTTEETVIQNIRNIFKPEKTDMDNIIEILFSKKEKKLIPSKAGLGGKRKKEFEKYGFGVSNAAHTIRLLGELYELLTTGNITFPRDNAEILKNIRQGKYTFEEVKNNFYIDITEKVKKVKENSLLKKKPNEKKVWEVYKKIINNFLLSDKRFREYNNIEDILLGEH